MTPSPASASPSVSGARKAAMFVMGLGTQGAELLRQLDPDEIRRISTEISGLQSVAPDNMLSVFREFEALSGTSRFFAKGGADYARRLVEQAVGPESAQKLLAGPLKEAPPSVADLEILQQTGPQQLAVLLRDENPQTIALILSNLPAEQAGALMTLLPAELQSQVALRMATLDRISPEVFRRITEVIGNKLKAVRQVSRSDGIKSLAGLLNHVDPAMADTILGLVEEQNQAAAISVRDMMFVFDDVLGIDKEGIKALLGKCDRKVLTTALKGTTGKIREHFTQCMSQRAAEMMVEDMDALGPVRIRDVQAAQTQVVSIIRQLQQQGVVATSHGGGDEYVV